MSIGIIRNLGSSSGGGGDYSADIIADTSLSDWNGTSGSPTITKSASALSITASGYADTYTECSIGSLCEIIDGSVCLIEFSEDRGSNTIEVQVSANGTSWTSIYSISNSVSAKSYATITGISSDSARIRIRYKNGSSSQHTLVISSLRICI